ncbi:MAG: helix-turn-helix transcriptional regulator [Treponema sp.]|nr:helix-turn-helix transcriptional regulator [Treponema sp.]
MGLLMYGKKILIVGTDTNAVHAFSKDFEIELVSSVSFIDTVLFSFMPDIIVLDSMYDADIRSIRENPKLSRVPVLLVAENVSYLKNFSQILGIPYLLVCNSAILSNQAFQDHLKKIAEVKVKLLPSKTSSLVKQTILNINMSYSSPITRDVLAQKLNASADYLSRIFKKEMGMQLWDYVNAYRLSEAKNMLLETGRSIKDISFSTGFSDPAYFTRLFHRMYGLSPSSYRSR